MLGLVVLVLAGCGGGGGGHAATTTVGEVGGQAATTSTTSTTAASTSGTATSTNASGSAPPSAGAPVSANSGTGAQGAGGHNTAGGGGGKSGSSGGQGRRTAGRGGSHSTAASHQSGGHPAAGAGIGAGAGSGAATTPSPAPNANTGVPYEVTTTSMQPSFKPFTTVYYNPTLTTPKIGEVVLFFLPVGATEGACGNIEGGGEACQEPRSSTLTHTLSMKRVVGLPGDTIAMREGIVIRNGQPVSEPYATGCSGAGCEYSKPITVPAGSYYVLSDSREHYQEDSRVFGAVPQAAVAGTVEGG